MCGHVTWYHLSLCPVGLHCTQVHSVLSVTEEEIKKLLSDICSPDADDSTFYRSLWLHGILSIVSCSCPVRHCRVRADVHCFLIS